MAQSWVRFCPNLNIPQYREPLSEEKKRELDQRATKLFKRAIGNQLYMSSEFSWEVCAWHDAFGLIMEDQGLRMSVYPCPVSTFNPVRSLLTDRSPQGQEAI